MQSMKTVYITDITLHTKDFRDTVSFAKAEKKSSPRIYSTNNKVEAVVEEIHPDGSFSFVISLPQDLREGLDRGEIEICQHPKGTLVYAGKDIYEKLEQMKQKERREQIHAGRVWRKK
jgi:hypothetical protein